MGRLALTPPADARLPACLAVQAKGKVPTVQQVYSVDREGEAERFAEHAALGNRRLMWHGAQKSTLTCRLCPTPRAAGSVPATLHGQAAPEICVTPLGPSKCGC